MEKDKIVKVHYQELVDEAMFDVEKGNEPLTQENLSKPLDEFVDTINAFYEKEKVGCCMVFATRLKKVLEEKGITTWYALSTEKNNGKIGIRGSLLYVGEDGTFKILNPVAEIERKKEATDKIKIDDVKEMTIDKKYHEFYDSTNIESDKHYILILPNAENLLSYVDLLKMNYGIADKDRIYATNVDELAIDANEIASGNPDPAGQNLLKEIQESLNKEKKNKI